MQDSQTITWYSKEGLEEGLDREAGENFSVVEEEDYKENSVSSTRFKQKNKDRSTCIRLCDRQYIIYEMQK